jgi:hypothetical protein
MNPLTPSRHASHSLTELARQLAPHLRIISASRPAPVLRDHNVLAIAGDADVGRRAVRAMEGTEHADDQLGSVVMGAVTDEVDSDSADDRGRVDPEGVGRQVVPHVLLGGLLGAIAGAIVVGGGALLLGAEGWEVAGAAAAGAMLLSVFGAMWRTFAGLGGGDAYRRTFVDDAATELTIVSVHTDDPDAAEAARSRLAGINSVTVLSVDRFGHVVDEPSSSNTKSSDR